VQYTRNMATGASTADVAVILVDARLGVLPQTRRHAHIAALLGIPNVVACVNKMDLVDFAQAKFDAIAQELSDIAKRVELKGLFAIPVSALAGDNVVTASTKMPWWTGGTMLHHLENVNVADVYRASAFRMSVQIVLRPGIGYRGFAGQIASGTIKNGDEVIVLPSGRRTRVVGVDFAGADVGIASAPSSVALRLADDIDISRGDMLARPDELPQAASEMDADLVWMSERPLDSGRTYLLKHTTRTVRAEIEVLHGADAETLAPSAAHVLALNDIGRVRVRCRAPIFFDAYRENRATGAFILIDSVTNDTVAAGMIVGVAPRAAKAGAADPASALRTQVSADERHARLGQVGAVVRLLAPSDDTALALAFTLERELFDRGTVATVVHGAVALEAAAACALGGLVALVPSRSPGGGFSAEISGERLAPCEGEDAEHLVRRVAEALVSRKV
jgi:sulfate adenylyltransferase large subunit